MAPWLRFLEAYMVRALLRTPAFHRGVEKVVKRVHQFRHGIPPEEMGGTKIDIDGPQGEAGFGKHFLDEVKTQIGAAEQRETASGAVRTQGVKDDSVNVRRAVPEEEDSDAAWQNMQKSGSQAPKAGFMEEYMDALREQVRNQNKGG
ncbi:hypothetical protein CLAFUW4_13117 [Fulvia fulva]|uniref:Uncharacterized protein n=1 Tax=Passalora fulva TaxID=5499 RepID=A0A9Q8PJP0_PASFU|nr:uncharacterized protein CLAFUR5_12976 [Fulvia fulva]KAK4612042.1 hypothetical protein CLAFUR4_13121 [Fulvia fulva]KAK4613118.1 hypothetical protein CLAFUR0_13126 [Fulvia fulva]UJO23894.1 hypothetical protein CLAFUR5_12976 [Fulvia fulva]WPV21374.1 hypothetical protein CLAFUW4_13117 [Fulvia fulva]WPV36599.1 hypothetical protein CLAFUW7_13125 [Fulvia fulva]